MQESLITCLFDLRSESCVLISVTFLLTIHCQQHRDRPPQAVPALALLRGFYSLVSLLYTCSPGRLGAYSNHNQSVCSCDWHYALTFLCFRVAFDLSKSFQCLTEDQALHSALSPGMTPRRRQPARAPRYHPGSVQELKKVASCCVSPVSISGVQAQDNISHPSLTTVSPRRHSVLNVHLANACLKTSLF